MTLPGERLTALEAETARLDAEVTRLNARQDMLETILRRVRRRVDPPDEPGPDIPRHQRGLPRAPKRPREPRVEGEPTEPDPPELD